MNNTWGINSGKHALVAFKRPIRDLARHLYRRAPHSWQIERLTREHVGAWSTTQSMKGKPGMPATPWNSSSRAFHITKIKWRARARVTHLEKTSWTLNKLEITWLFLSLWCRVMPSLCYTSYMPARCCGSLFTQSKPHGSRSSNK